MPQTNLNVLDRLETLSRTWAAYGLNAGKSALESSAKSLQATADFLGNLSTRITATEKPQAAQAETAVEAQPSEPSELKKAAEKKAEKAEKKAS